MPTDAERVGGGSDTHPPGPHFHNPVNAEEKAFVALLSESGDAVTVADTARLNAIRPKAVATGDDHTVSLIDTLLA